MINPLIKKLNEKKPSAKWIRSESHLPYLELDLNVPTDKILNEWQQVEHLAKPHRIKDTFPLEAISSSILEYDGAKHKGWNGLTLYGVDKNITEDSQEPYSWTDIADQCPETKKWLVESFTINEQTGRIRFMDLAPGGFIMPHKDYEEHRLCPINVAITNPEQAEFRMLNHGRIPFAQGKAFMLDISNQHWVYNESNEHRLHIIVHEGVSDNIIEKSYANSRY